MSGRGFGSVGLVVVLVGFLALSASSKDEPGDPAAAARAWYAEMGRVGENHAWLDFMTGSWQTEVKFWQGPGEPQTSTGTAECHWILDKHYIRLEYSGEAEGQPFHGESTVGYDNVTKRYESLWIDGMSTNQSFTNGTREGDVVTLTGTVPTPWGPTPERDVLTKLSPDEWTVEAYWTMPQPGTKEGAGEETEQKIMELRYRRAK